MREICDLIEKVMDLSTLSIQFIVFVTIGDLSRCDNGKIGFEDVLGLM